MQEKESIILRDIDICNYYKEGLSSRQISAKTGISNTQIRRILKRNNIEFRDISANKSHDDEIVQLYSSGLSSEKISEKLGYSASFVTRALKRNGITPRKKHTFDLIEDYFEKIDTEDKAYFLGYIFADGSINKRGYEVKLCLHNQDAHILKTFSNIIYKGVDRTKTYNEPYINLFIFGKKICDDLAKLGCTNRKSFTIRMPKIDDHLMKHFIRGVFDGDGCYYSGDKNNISVSVIGNKLFINDIKNYLTDKLGIIGSFSKSKKSEKIYNLFYASKGEVSKLINYLYSDSTVFLTRKKEKAESIIKKIDAIIELSEERILEFNGNKLTKDYIDSLSIDERERISNYLFNYFREREFPFPKYSEDELFKDLESIRNHKVIENNSEIITNTYSGYKIVHHFCENYFKVSSKLPSIYEAYYNDEKLKNAIDNRLGISYKETFTITANIIRTALKNSRQAFGASFFKPAVAKYIYDKYAPEDSNVLDISAGFGQRMIGANLSKNVKNYTGLDPWDDAITSLSAMRDHFTFNAELIHIGSENFNRPDYFDFCFSSPPFFDKEIYSTHESQANSKTYVYFINDWWDKTYKNVHNSLKEKSLFILNMSSKYAELMLDSCKNHFYHEKTIFISYERKHLKKKSKDNYYILRKI